MKLWKKFLNEKKVISRQDNMKDIVSFKSTRLIQNQKLNKNKKQIESKKSLKSFSKSFSSSSSEFDLESATKPKNNLDKDLKGKTIQIDLADKKFNQMKLLTTTLSSDILNKNKKNNIKTIYPTIPNSKSRKKNFLIKLKKKANSPSNYNNNSLLNKWTDNINKLFSKSLKKTRKEMIQILKKHKILNIKKHFKTRNITTINKDQEENNKDTNNNIEVSSPLKNTYSYNIPLNYLSSEQYSQQSSGITSRSVNKFEYNRNNNYYSNNKGYGYYDRNYQRKINYRIYMKEENILNTNWKKKLGILNTDIKYSTDLLSSLDFNFVQ